ncbi:hypothetical protein TRIUR3_04424 [Triticum urartu]|uniref:Uncharacterized protein n=1 Tax=Triticum urartu TaxID=4572 RepID=M8ASY7_TRIUA|nr:hypothetical protein TRIUR3_04424 [Triticum urartu]
MLAIFQKQVAHAPQELNSPRGSTAKPKIFAALACVAAQPRNLAAAGYQRMFCGLDDIYCVFMGTLDNLSALMRHTDGGVPLHWGVAADGSVVICDDRGVAKAGCGRSYAPFPPGCMFHSEGGLKSFEHPMNRLKAFPRVDSEGVMCGANFKVDAFTKINSMPRVGSATNWAATWDDAAI